MTKKIWLYSLVVMLLLLSSFSMGGCAPKEPGIMKVGMVMSTSGPAAAVGGGIADGIRIAVKHWNDNGGITIGGQPYTIELIEYDSAMKPEQGVSATKKLIEQDQVLVMFGDCISSVALAQKPIIEEAGIPWITFGAHPGLTQDRKYTFRCNALASDLATQQMLILLNDYGVTKWSFITEESALPQQVAAALIPALESAGATVLTADTNPAGYADFYPMLTKIKAAGPELVRIDGSGDAITILKQAKEIGLETEWFVGSQVSAAELLEQLGDLAVGVWQTVMMDLEADTASMKGFLVEAEAFIGKEPTMLNGLGYEGSMRMLMAIDLANSLDGSEIVDALYQVDWEGVYFTGKYHADGEGTMAAKTMQLTADGTYIPLEYTPKN